MIKIEEKISQIEVMEKSRFLEIIAQLLYKFGYTEVNTSEDASYLLAKFSSPVNDEWHIFISFEEKLSGNVNYDTIIKKISELRSTDSFFSSIFIVSQLHISNGFRETIKKHIPNNNVVAWDRDQIIRFIDEKITEYWRHDDLILLDYEKHYCDSILKESELKKLKIFNEKYQKLLDIFITPTISHYYEDKETKTPLKKNIQIDYIIDGDKPIILSGEPGSGKSTTLKRIGEFIIKNNKGKVKKNLPVFITVTELFDYKFEVELLVVSKLVPFFKQSIDEIFSDYNIILLVDSIDEFELENQIIISTKLIDLFENKGVKFILGTRSAEKNVSIDKLKNCNNYHIQKFKNEQIQQFVNKFFFNQKSRAEKLLDALKENRVLEKLPITPLSLSLISILFEENDLEIPATITDIYENFNSLLLGKAILPSRMGFIDISFKERILSVYAFELLKRKEHNPMTKDEFFAYFSNYFQTKTLTIDKGNLEAVLQYLIDNTGIIYLKNNKYVSFNHDSFMEFYAALEIFKHQRKEENMYVENFFDLSWQNSAVFYAGKSKDMEDFLNNINNKLESAININDFLMGVNGAGYLLQALYQTNNNLRKKTIDIACELNLKAHDFFIKMASDDDVMFKNYKLPLIWMINVMYFYENFNSITLKEPLKLAFVDNFNDFKLKPSSIESGYKAFKIATTLSSNRINEQNELEQLITTKESPFLKSSILTILADICLGFLNNNDKYKEIKKEVRKDFKKIKPVIKHLLEIPASKLRFTSYDQIKGNKRVKIITEGKTDSEILEHAFMTLTNGESPYWTIKPAGNESGGASEVKKILDFTSPTLFNDEIIIGIFDHDDAGLGCFNGLSNSMFDLIKPNTVKKHKLCNIYAVVLPIPGENDNYIRSEQKFNYFSIEHYFPLKILEEYEVLENTPLVGIHSIKTKKKNSFSQKIRKLTEPEIFKNLIYLFNEIDIISGIDVEYLPNS